MSRPKKDSSSRKAIEHLRAKHSDKLESIFLAEYAIVMSDKAEDKDKNNASKVCVSMLGVARPALEREAVPKGGTGVPGKDTMKKPELPTQLKEQLARLLDNGTTRP